MEQRPFGYWLRLKRKALDLTREELAERVGYSAATIRKIEEEERHPSKQVVERLAEIFNIPLEERSAFLRFARGDWQSAPTTKDEDSPWRVSQLGESGNSSQTKSFLATFLFTDIEGSSKLWEDEPEKMNAALHRHHQILQKAISSQGGTVFQIVGDAFCAAFPTVKSALSAAVRTQQELHREPWNLPFPVRVRMGIHTGEAEQTSTGGYASNPTLNRVARILSAAHGGQVLVSLATRDLVKDSLPAGTELRDMGEHCLKNLMYPERLFQLNIAGLSSNFPPLNTLTHRHNLPVQVTSFIAREAEIALVHEYLLNDDIRLVTLMGPPGIGKTRLSIEAARAALQDFPDGVFFVALAPLDDQTRIASTITQALGYVEARNISATEQLKEGIGDKNLLLVLDNCEHLIDAVASLISGLLSACPRLKIVATSRESMRIPGEWLYTIPAFDLSTESTSLNVESASNYPALTLFAERARAVRSDFSLNPGNIETVAAICARLDGLPLVIELIAARMRLMTPQTLLERLSGQFVLTADGMRAASERQKTLHNAINWSYQLLPPEEQKLFAYLSVFSGSFTLEAVEAMLSQKVTEKPLPTLIALLLDKSLLKLDSNLEESDEARYTMLVTIQAFARECLREMGDEMEIRNLHLAYFLDFSKQGGYGMRGGNQLEWLHHLNAARDNLRTALDWAIEINQTEVALQLVRNLHWFWFVHSDHNEARRSFKRVLAMPDAHTFPELQAEVLTQWAHHLWTQGGSEEAMPLAERAFTIARARNDKFNIARALTIRGLILVLQRNFIEAQSNLEESRELFQELHNEWEYAHTVMGLALCADKQNNLTASLALHQQALMLFREVNDLYFQSFALDFIGILQVKGGDVNRGITALREALILAQQLDSKNGIASAISRLAATAQHVGDPARGVHLYWAARNIWASIGIWRQEDEVDFENWLAPSRAALDEAELEEAVEQGRAMTMEQAIAYALESRDV